MANDGIHVSRMLEDIMLEGRVAPSSAMPIRRGTSDFDLEYQGDMNPAMSSPPVGPNWDDIEDFLRGEPRQASPQSLSETHTAEPAPRPARERSEGVGLEERALHVTKAMGSYLEALSSFRAGLGNRVDGEVAESVDELIRNAAGDLRQIREVWSRVKG